MGRKPQELISQRFGRLIVVSLNRKSYWNCLCDCGNSAIVRGNSLTMEVIKSCGCLRTESNKSRAKHNEWGKTKEYTTWSGIKDRCFNTNYKKYKDYGGRGITVCDRWIDSYDNFLKDMGRAPSQKHTIERENVNGNYEPSNCRWATMKEQQNNRRNNRMIEFNGLTMTLSQWCSKLNINYKRTQSRLNLGWSIEDSFEQKTPEILAVIPGR